MIHTFIAGIKSTFSTHYLGKNPFASTAHAEDTAQAEPEHDYMWFPDGDGVPQLIDLKEPVDPAADFNRNVNTITFNLFTRLVSLHQRAGKVLLFFFNCPMSNYFIISCLLYTRAETTVGMPNTWFSTTSAV